VVDGTCHKEAIDVAVILNAAGASRLSS